MIDALHGLASISFACFLVPRVTRRRKLRRLIHKGEQEKTMSNQVRRFYRVSAIFGLFALMGLFGAVPAGAGNSARFHGTFTETPAGAELGYDIHGSAKMTVWTDATAVKVNVSGLDPAKAYGSHLHNGTCASGGGGHYQDDEGGDIEPPNELWITNSGTTLSPNPGGVGHGGGSADWAARVTSTTQTNARSVVIHEPGGTRIACADLT
ncbi:MAG: hypothetical protein HKN24_14380 [Acidimicrobiales bacterium]|nr:hypothetical protein [Acidimicrobiales bacterium]